MSKFEGNIVQENVDEEMINELMGPIEARLNKKNKNLYLPFISKDPHETGSGIKRHRINSNLSARRQSKTSDPGNRNYRSKSLCQPSHYSTLRSKSSDKYNDGGHVNDEDGKNESKSIAAENMSQFFSPVNSRDNSRKKSVKAKMTNKYSNLNNTFSKNVDSCLRKVKDNPGNLRISIKRSRNMNLDMNLLKKKTASISMNKETMTPGRKLPSQNQKN